jgi:hypothetical protein
VLAKEIFGVHYFITAALFLILKKLGKESWTIYLPPFFLCFYVSLLAFGYHNLLPDWMFEKDLLYQQLTAFFLLVLFSAINYVSFSRTIFLLPIALMVPNYFCLVAEARFVKDEATNELLDEDQ